MLLRGVDFDNPSFRFPIVIYWASASFSGLVGLAYVRLSRVVHGTIPLSDLVKIFKAALLTSLGGVVGTYFVSHFQHVPRFVPIIHFLIFSGLLIAWMMWRLYAKSALNLRQSLTLFNNPNIEHQLLIGCGPLSVHYAALIDEMPQSGKKIAGVVSIRSDLAGATLGRRTVLGPIDNIKQIIDDFENHGVVINRIVLTTLDEGDQGRTLEMVSPHCVALGIKVSTVTELIGEGDGHDYDENDGINPHALTTVKQSGAHGFLNEYLVRRQQVEVYFALIFAVLIFPIVFIISLIVFLDVGRPLIFWQRRVGRGRNAITVHKFRTLPNKTEVTAHAERMPSWIGRILQATRLDELPQIFDIIERRLSFIGPRPLLSKDLPRETGLRETVLPGVTGWAQVHGGKNISPDEKIALDNWYIRHASLKLDALILYKTLIILIRGHDERNENVIASAVDEFRSHRTSGAGEPDRGQDLQTALSPKPVHEQDDDVSLNKAN